jgi:hypothetical protein
MIKAYNSSFSKVASVITVAVSLLMIKNMDAQVENEIHDSIWNKGRDYSHPVIVDIDRDGLLDLLMKCKYSQQDQGGIWTFPFHFMHFEEKAPSSYDFKFLSEGFSGLPEGFGGFQNSMFVPTVIDIDHDGLYEVFVSDFVEGFGYCKQTAPGTYDFTPFRPIDLPSGGEIAFANIDHDDLIDLFFSTGSTITRYEQTHPESAAAFTLVATEFSGISIVEYGEITSGDLYSLEFVDLDSDSLFDLFIGSSNNLFHYEQTHINGSEFSVVENWFCGIGWKTSPYFYLDDDSTYHMFLGDHLGRISHYQQNSPNPYDFELQTMNVAHIDVGSHSAPAVSDIDGDDLIDLLIGTYGGNISHFEQKSPGSLEFTFVSDFFSGIDSGYEAVPVLCDIDNDTNLDLLIGQFDGSVSHYEQANSYSYDFIPVYASFVNLDVGFSSQPACYDIDHDGLFDILISNGDGRVYHYEQDQPDSYDLTLISDQFNELSIRFLQVTDLDNDGLADMLARPGVSGYISHYKQVVPDGYEFALANDRYYSIIEERGGGHLVTIDMDDNGIMELILGSKDGGLRIFKDMEVLNVDDLLSIPSYMLMNYPNPFNPVTTIRYDLPHASEVSLIVCDLLGREVARLVDGYLEPGYHEVLWNGRDFPSGIYIARLVTPGYSKAIKMVLLK